METFDAIRARRNVRAFSDRPIPAADLERILEAGRRAPSAGNSQPWDFILVTGRERLSELGGVWQGARHIPGSAATVCIVAPVVEEQRRREFILFDLGQAAMSMMLAAADLGVGSGHSAVGDQDLARKLLEFPEDRYVALMIAFGYPADGPLKPLRRPNRRPLDQIVHRDHW